VYVLDNLMRNKKVGTHSINNILIVDDHSGVRRALRWLINNESDLTVCAIARSFRHAQKVIKDNSFDLAIIDISLGDANGLELTRVIKSRDPDTSVVIYSAHDDLLCVERAFQSGACGYLVKSPDTTKEILTAIRQVLKGNIYISRRISQEYSANDIDRISPASARFVR
jgi:two-component system invasion response regulator UvrY